MRLKSVAACLRSGSIVDARIEARGRGMRTAIRMLSVGLLAGGSCLVAAGASAAASATAPQAAAPAAYTAAAATCGNEQEVCLFRGGNSSTDERDYPECDDDWFYNNNHFDSGAGLNDRVTYVRNRSSTPISFYSEFQKAGVTWYIGPWESADFSGRWFNNEASSHNWSGC